MHASAMISTAGVASRPSAAAGAVARAPAAAGALRRGPAPAASKSLTLRAGTRRPLQRARAGQGGVDDPLNSGALDGVFTEDDLNNLGAEDRARIDEMVAATMDKIKDNPEAQAAFKEMVKKVQSEQEADPEAFQAKMKQAQEMQMIQMRAFLFQVMKLDPEDPDVGHVVKDLTENGEAAFEKYANDQAMGMLLQKKCMIKAITDMIVKIPPENEKLGQVRKNFDEQGAAYAEMLMNDQQIMLELTRFAVLDDPYALHGATRVGDLETLTYILDNGGDPNAEGSAELNGAAPLHIAAAAGLMEPAALLLERGAAIDLATPATQGNSPLHFAIGYGQPKMVEFLLARGANKYGTNANGQLPEEMANLLQDEALKSQTLAALN